MRTWRRARTPNSSRSSEPRAPSAPTPCATTPRDTPAARAAAAVLSLRYYRRAQKTDTAAILEELAPLTDYREEITAPDALRREALVSVLTDYYDAALSAAEEQAEATPRRDQATAICQAVERQVRA